MGIKVDLQTIRNQKSGFFEFVLSQFMNAMIFRVSFDLPQHEMRGFAC